MATRSSARGRAMHAVWALAALAVCTAPAAAQDYDPFHWGYGPVFGSGAYRLSDGAEARIVRISPAFWVRKSGVRRGPNLGVRLLLPFSIGVQNLDDEDLPPGRADDKIEHAAFLPGFELEFPGRRFAVRARVQAGWGTELEGEEISARLYAIGVRSRFGWPHVPGKLALISGLQWAGFDPDGGERRSLLRLSQGLEFDVDVPRWQFNDGRMHLMPHVLADWYYRPPPELSFGDEEFDHVETEWQVGLAARREGGFKILFFKLDAIGIAYRFSEHSAGVRFYLNSIF